jgi:hypothetical protein
MIKQHKGFKTLVIFLFFALCMPTMAYGNEDGNMSESEISEIAGAEPITESPEELADSQEPAAEETKDSSEESIEEDATVDPVEDKEASEAPAAIIEEEPIVKEDAEKKVDEELKEKEPQQIQMPEQVILTSVEGMPSEAIVEFTLDGRRIGLFSNGIVSDAVPILAADQQRIRASIISETRIVGAKIIFDTYVIQAPPAIENPMELVNPIETAIPEKPAEPTDPVEPAEPTNPTEPVEPVKPANPTEPVETAEPVDPIEDLESVENKQPESEKTIENEEPMQSKDPANESINNPTE